MQYNWVKKMVYIGREIIGLEYLDQVAEMDHWAFGPHHLWTEPDTGNIIRYFKSDLLHDRELQVFIDLLILSWSKREGGREGGGLRPVFKEIYELM